MFRRILTQVVTGLAARWQNGDPLDTVAEAERKLADENPAGAERLLADRLKAHPGDTQALCLLGRALNRQGRHHDALAAALRALELGDEPKAREEVAHAHIGLRNIPDAFAIFAPVLAELSGAAIDPVKRAHAHVAGDLNPAEKVATLRTAFLILNNGPAAEACDRLLSPANAANGEYRVFETRPSLLDYCQHLNLPSRLAPEAELIPMGKSVPGDIRVPAFIGALPEGLVIGQSFIPASDDGVAFAERFVHNPGRIALWGRSIPSDIVRGFGGTQLLTSSSGLDRYQGDHLLVGNFANVGHWLLNHLARLWWLDRLPELGQTALVIGANASASQIEFLLRMGIDRERVLQIPGGRLAQFERIWAPAMLYGAVGRHLYWWPGIVPFIRDRLGMEFRSPPTRRVFITRRTARWRRLLNEREILDVLAPFGFEVVDPGALSVAEQIALAGSAQIIAGVFGAGMMLLMFAAAGTPIVEFKYDVGNTMDLHPVISRAVGLPYFGVAGLPDESEPDLLKRDFRIAPGQARDAVVRALEAAGV